MKDLLFGDSIRIKMMEGIEILTNAVKVTLGPKGKNVVLERQFNTPLITKDGVTVAKEIELKDKYQNIGVQVIKEVASKTSEKAGDGTTTATILAYTMMKEGLKYIAAGINAIDLKKGMEKAIIESIKELIKMSKKCKTTTEIYQVASISANNDNNIGKYISEAVEKIGKEGIITVEEGKSLEDELEVVEGMQFERGYVSPYFITDQEKQISLLENSFILIYNKKIYNIEELINILEQISKSKRPLLIMAEDIDSEVLATLILNNLRGNIKTSVVKLPGFGERRKEILEDIAILTGGTVITEEMGLSIKKLSISDLGQAKKIEVQKENTIIVGGAGDEHEISKRIKNLSNQIIESKSQYEAEKLQERLSKLSNGVAVIRVGAATETEMKEKKARVEDALHATRAAIEEGIVPGGGVALLRIKEAISKLEGDNIDQNYGIKIVLKAMEEPIKQIIMNGGEETGVIINKIIKNKNINFGYNVIKREYSDLLEDGVVDPTKVTRSALQNASSITSLLLTTEAGIVNAKKQKDNNEENEEDID
ncbi:molecular chaperone GroEL [Candidatus Nasuia deltocephalinicola]|uniref:Chaperonin GroEL n=1 Tax=Candidatus Nasuia deltocephalincola TaxID=1160784 RepID=A0A974WMV3_9PROT|nr:chaperonin GroEL [Candidatus Nasuia deltocephalinicola]BEH03917.1 molecular chaperone GroEL [Candidatus Nasuia deltocephalinicola]